jgi:sugar phosphate isomerase/epimerase
VIIRVIRVIRVLFYTMITRRNFLKTTTLATTSMMLAPGLLQSCQLIKHTGLQLYTLRDLISKDLKGTLVKVAETGYTWLEAAGYSEGKFYGLAPSEFRKMVNDLGMKVVSSHVAFSPENSQEVIDAHLELGASYVVYPWMSMPELPTREDYSKAANLFNKLGEDCRSSGLKFGYHNHSFEFVKIDDTTGFDLLLGLTEPKSVCFEADLYWMVYAGVDPVEYFRKYPGRFELWHVKDMDDSPERGFAPVGTGIIDFGKIFSHRKISGMSYFFAEQDTCKDDPLESIAVSHKNLLKLVYSK